MAGWQIDHAQDNQGMMAEISYNLATEKPNKVLISPAFLFYKTCSVEVQCIGCTGTSGDVTLFETNNQQGSTTGSYTTGVTVALGVDSQNYSKVLNMAARHLALEFPSTLGILGKLIIRIVGKN